MLQIVLGSIAGIFCLWAYRRAEKAARGIDQARCRIFHRVGRITFRHYEGVSCERAAEVATEAREAWKWLEPDFPNQRERFIVDVIFDRKLGQGSQRATKVVINLAKQDDEDDLRSAITEEVHHLRAWRAGERGEYVFLKRFYNPEDKVRYYAENDFEHQALCSAVARVPTKRAELLKKAKEYRALHGIK